MNATDPIEIISNYYTRAEARITYTGESGPIQGITFFGGVLKEHPTEGAVVVFTRTLDNVPAWDAMKKHGLKKDQGLTLKLTGKPVLAGLVERARVALAAELARQDAEALTLEPLGFLYESGCDSSSTYLVLWPESASDFARESRAKSLGTATIKTWLRDADFKAIAEATGAAPVAANMSTWGGWRFDRAGLDALLSLANERQVASDASGAAKKAGQDRKIADAKADAAQSGKPVEIGRWTEDCDGSVDECSADLITRFAMPDGTMTTRRTHTH